MRMKRRKMLAVTLGFIGSAFAAMHGISCALPTSVDIRTRPKDIGESASLGLKKGRTTLKETIMLLRKKGATGISLSHSLDVYNEKVHLHALTADYLGSALVFRNGKFGKALDFKARKGTAKGIYLKFTRMGKANAVIAISENMVVFKTNGILILTDHPTPKRIHISQGHFPEWIYGMKDPLVIGDDLEKGVTFVARKAAQSLDEYVPWHYGVILKCDGKKLSVKTKLMDSFLGCDCVYDWFDNPPEKRKKDPFVSPYLGF